MRVTAILGYARVSTIGQDWLQCSIRPADDPVTGIDRRGRYVAEVTRNIAELGNRRITLRA